MEERVILNEDIEAFRRYLLTEEKSDNTKEKYIRDVRAVRLSARVYFRGRYPFRER